jgi:hypothetical protein
VGFVSATLLNNNRTSEARQSPMTLDESREREYGRLSRKDRVSACLEEVVKQERSRSI